MVPTPDLEQVREMSLGQLLTCHGLLPKREGTTVRYKNHQFNIVVSKGSLWFDNAASLGGRGAIDLILHLKYGVDPRSASDRALRDAIGWLSSFDPNTATNIPVRETAKPVSPKATFADQAAIHAIRDDARWPLAESYLVQARHLPAHVVKQLHANGDIYASFSQGYPNLTGICFVHRNLLGEVRGATIRNVSAGPGYAYSIGEKAGAWFGLGDALQANQAILVEAPIDAISYAALRQPRETVILAMSGSHASKAVLDTAHERRWELTVGFDNDQPGHAGWQRCRKNYALLYPDDRQPSRTLPAGKDWNDDLRSAPRQRHGRRL